MSESRREVTVETVAECFEVEVHWLRRVCEVGLVDDTPPPRRVLSISVDRLERIARIVRWHRQGVTIEGISILLATHSEP